MAYLLFRRRTFFLLIAPLAMLAVARPTRASVAVGLPLVILGEAGRIWSAGYLSKLTRLVTAGPYALCRNPIYVSMFVLTLGYFAMCNRPVVWIVGIAMFWLFHGGAIAYEERLLRERFGEEYAEYCRRVPRFVPRLGPISGEGTFTWRQLVLNNEHLSAAATVVLSSLFVAGAFMADRAGVGWLTALGP